MNKIDNFNSWWNPGFGALGLKSQSVAFQAYLQGIAWKEQQDLAAVEAVRQQATTEPWIAACQEITERIKEPND